VAGKWRGVPDMEKGESVLAHYGRVMAERMSPSQKDEAKRLWDAIRSDGLTAQNLLHYRQFTAKTFGTLISPTEVRGRTASIALNFGPPRVEKKPPKEAEFVLFMVSRERRDDIVSDLSEWYPSWCAKFGTRRAKFLCWWRVMCCVGGAVLEVLGRVGEIIGKMAPK
jgi:hypothetical protein